MDTLTIISDSEEERLAPPPRSTSKPSKPVARVDAPALSTATTSRFFPPPGLTSGRSKRIPPWDASGRSASPALTPILPPPSDASCPGRVPPPPALYSSPPPASLRRSKSPSTSATLSPVAGSSKRPPLEVPLTAEKKVRKKRKSAEVQIQSATDILLAGMEAAVLEAEKLHNEGQEEITAQRMKAGLEKFKLGQGPLPFPSPLMLSHSELMPPVKPTRVTKIKATAEPAIVLPSNTYLAALPCCPLCKAKWLPTKIASVRATHLRKCAATHEYSAETVRVLTDKLVLEVGAEEDLKRREAEEAKTLFDRAVGRGEGVTVAREVRVVGVEVEGDGGWGQFDSARLARVQLEIDEERAKVKLDKSIKVAAQIKEARKKARELQNALERERRQKEDEEEEELWSQTGPELTGRLKGDSTQARQGTILKSTTLLKALAGSGLTQPLNVASLPSQKFIAKMLRPVPSSSTLATASESMDVDIIPAPPTTQEFLPSKLAEQFVRAGRGESVALSAKTSSSSEDAAAPKRKGRGKGKKTLLAEAIALGSDEEPSTRDSLWAAATGLHDAAVKRKVPLLSTSSNDQTKGPYRDQEMSLSSSPPTPPPLPRLATKGTKSRSLSRSPSEEVEMEGGGEGVLIWEGNEQHSSTSDGEVMEVEQVQEKQKQKSSPRKAALKKAKPIKIAKPKRTPSPAPPPSPPPVVEPMPLFDSYDTTVLRAQVSDFGFRPSNNRVAMIDQLERCWIMMHPPPGTGGLKRKTVRKKKVVAEEENEFGEGETVGERLRLLILEDMTLYTRILRYEPIHLDEFIDLSVANGLKGSRALIIRCLDEQSVTFYMNKPGENRPRTRR